MLNIKKYICIYFIIIPSCLQFLSIPSSICCTLLPESSNINEVIRVVLKFLFYFILFFFTKIFCTHKKHQKHEKHQNYKKAHKRNQAKTQNANKWTKIKNAFKKYLSGKKTNSLICVFSVFWARRKTENRKNENYLQCNVLNTNVPINHFRKSS